MGSAMCCLDSNRKDIIKQDKLKTIKEVHEPSEASQVDISIPLFVDKPHPNLNVYDDARDDSSTKEEQNTQRQENDNHNPLDQSFGSHQESATHKKEKKVKLEEKEVEDETENDTGDHDAPEESKAHTLPTAQQIGRGQEICPVQEPLHQHEKEDEKVIHKEQDERGNEHDAKQNHDIQEQPKIEEPKIKEVKPVDIPHKEEKPVEIHHKEVEQKQQPAQPEHHVEEKVEVKAPQVEIVHNEHQQTHIEHKKEEIKHPEVKEEVKIDAKKQESPVKHEEKVVVAEKVQEKVVVPEKVEEKIVVPEKVEEKKVEEKVEEQKAEPVEEEKKEEPKAEGLNSLNFMTQIVSQFLYQTVQGDKVDELLGEAIKEAKPKIPIIRIATGRYLIGTEIKNCQIENDKFTVKVSKKIKVPLPLEEYLLKVQDKEITAIKKIMNEQSKTYKETVIILLQRQQAPKEVIEDVEKSQQYEKALF